MSSSRSGQQTHVSVHRLPLPEAAGDRGDLNIATLEYLYALTMRQDPEARFCLAGGGQRCDVAKNGYSHAELLRELA
jgi:hypothetical protein